MVVLNDRWARELVSICLEIAHFPSVCGVVKFHEAAVAEEAGALWGQFVILCQPSGVLPARVTWLALHLVAVQQPGIVLDGRRVMLGVEKPVQ